jgi:methionine biosynthesis protein MetW
MALNPKELYEKQFGEKKLVHYISFPFLRKAFKRFDLNSFDLTIKLLSNTGGDLLEIGCNDGSLLLKLRKDFNKVYGIDIAPTLIKEAKKKALQNFPKDNAVFFSVCDANKGLNFLDKTFETIVCLAVLEHIFDPYFLIDEINRVLKKNGVLVLQVPNIAYLKHRIHLLFGKLPVTATPYNWEEIGWDAGHLHYFTLKALRQLLEKKGFKIIKVSGSGLFAQFRNWWPSLLTGDIIIKAKKI